MQESRTAWTTLRSGRALVSGDVEGTPAFLKFSTRPSVACSFVMNEHGKNSLLGIEVEVGELFTGRDRSVLICFFVRDGQARRRGRA
jgi:hypothetical protein